MLKRFFSLLFALCLVLSLGVSSFAYSVSDVPYFSYLFTPVSDQNGHYSFPLIAPDSASDTYKDGISRIINDFSDSNKTLFVTVEKRQYASYLEYDFRFFSYDPSKVTITRKSIQGEYQWVISAPSDSKVSSLNYYVRVKEDGSFSTDFIPLSRFTYNELISSVLYNERYLSLPSSYMAWTNNPKSFSVISSTAFPSDLTKISLTSSLPNPSRSLSINYQYEDGSQAAPPIFQSLSSGDSYSFESPFISGYTPDRQTVSGVVGDGDISYIVTYRKSSFDLTIDYTFSDGSFASESFTSSFSPGDLYSVPSPLIKGYTPDIPTVSGVMPDKDLSLTVTYSDHVRKITIDYLNEDGTTAFPSYSDTFFVGFPYEISSPLLDGFSPDPSLISGVMPDEDLSFVVTYRKASHLLTVQFLLESGEEVSTAHTELLPSGSSYKVSSPSVEGYKPEQRFVSGSMPPSDLTLSIYYHPDYSGGDGSSSVPPDSGGGDNPFEPPVDDDFSGWWGDYEFSNPFLPPYGGSSGGSNVFDSLDAFFKSFLGGYRFGNPFDVK